MLNEKSVRKLVYLRRSQEMALKRLASEEGLSEAELIRRALDAFLATTGTAGVDPVMSLVGAFSGGGDPQHDSRTIEEDLYGDGDGP